MKPRASFKPHPLTALILALLLLVAARGAAEAPFEPAEAFAFPIEVTVRDGRTAQREMVATRIGENGEPAAFGGAELRSLLHGLTTPDTAAELGEESWISPEALRAAGFEVSYDPGSLAAEVHVPPEIQPEQHLSVRGSRSPSRHPRVEPAGLSAALPFYIGAQTTRSSGSDENEFTTGTRYGLNLRPQLGLGKTVLSGALEYGARADGGEIENVELEDWEAALSRDFGTGAGATRATAGTTRIDSLGFISSQPVFGAGLERREGIGGTPVLADRYQTSFEVRTQSTADIYVNERLIRSSRLAPGSYRVSEFPLLPGRNEVRIVITDVYGETRTIRSGVSHAPGLLPPGDTAFGLAGGFIDDEYEIALARAYLRRGLFDALSADLFTEATEQAQLAGAGAVTAGRLGILELSGATARINETDPEYAARGRYQLRAADRTWLPSLGLSALFRTERFHSPGALGGTAPAATPPLTPPVTPPWVLGASLNQALPFNANLLLGTRYTVGRGGNPDSSRVFAFFATQLGSRTNLRAGVTLDHSGEDRTLGGSITLSTITTGGRGRVGSTYHVADDELDLSAQHSVYGRAASATAGVSLDRIDLSEAGAASAGATLRAQNPRGEFSVAGRISPAVYPNTETDRDRATRHDLRARVGSGLYYADGLLGVGRPADGSFALVGKQPGLPAGPLVVNPGSRGYEARTGMLGAAVLTSLPDYYERPITSELPELPIEFTRDADVHTIVTGYRTGSAVRVGGAPLLYGSGTLLDEDGDPIALRVFRVIAEDGSAVATGFTDEDGTFRLYELTPGRYRVALTDGTPGAIFTLPDSIEPPFDLGVVSYSVNRETNTDTNTEIKP